MGTEDWYPGGRIIRIATGEVAIRNLPGRFPSNLHPSATPKRRLFKIGQKLIFH